MGEMESPFFMSISLILVTFDLVTASSVETEILVCIIMRNKGFYISIQILSTKPDGSVSSYSL